MKKLLCLILVLLLSMSVFAACGNKEENADDQKEIVSQNETEKLEIKKDTSSNEKQDFYLILNGTNEENIKYHTEKCPLLKDKEIQKASWEMITMLEFRHCSKCNPPKYEGYVE